MTLLDHTDPQQIKQDPNAKGDFCAHAQKHYDASIVTPCKCSESKKAENEVIYHVAHAQRHLNNYYNAECLSSVLHSLQAAEDRFTKCNEESTEKSYQFNQGLETEITAKKRKAIHTKHLQKKYHQHCLIRTKVVVA